MIADVCFLGPEERIINATRINIDKTLKIEFDISKIKTVKGIMKIIMNNIYCTIDEIIKIKINENISEKDEKKIIENIKKENLKKNKIEIYLDEECLKYYKGCVFYKVVEGYPEDYFLNLELKRW